MSEAAKRLSASCKFVATQPGPEEETEEERQERLAAIQQNQQIRKQAVGEEMANFLEVLGDVSSVLFVLYSLDDSFMPDSLSVGILLSFHLPLSLLHHRCWTKLPRRKYTCVNLSKKHWENR